MGTQDFNLKPDYKTIDPNKSFFAQEESTDNSAQGNKTWTEFRQSIDFIPKVSKASVYDVAAFVLEKLGEMTTMKLHKLVYYAQAWSLVWDEEALFTEEIQAWSNGPVVRELFNYHRGHYSLSSVSIGNSNILTQKQKDTINSVLEYYGNKSSQWLIELTHLELPWKNARKGLAPIERGNKVISLESIAEYYSSL